MTMTDAEIADLLANATPGPWPRAQYCIVVPSPEFSDGEIVCWAAKDLPFCDNELIAMAPTLARLALDRGKEIERLRAALNSIDALDPEWQGIENLSRDAATGLVMRMGDIARAALTGGNDAE